MPENEFVFQDLKTFLAARVPRSEKQALGSLEVSSKMAEGDPSKYEDLVASVMRRVAAKRHQVDRQRDGAQGLFEELLQHPEERRQVLVRNSARFWNWHMCALLVEESLQSGSRQPQRAVQFAELAIEVAENLDEKAYACGALEDLKARCWACLCNAQRINGEVSRATERALAKAERHLARGTGDRLEEAKLVGLKGALRGDQGRFDDCFTLFDHAASIYRRYGEDHLRGRILIKKGIFCGYAGNPEQAIQLFYESLELVDIVQEPRLMLAATHNLILNLNEMGRYEEATRLLEEKRSAYEDFGDRIDMLRLRWLEGRIARSHGRIDEAEEALAETREAFIQEGIVLDAALVSLEMAAIYLEQGRTGAIKTLAEEILPIFKASEFHREAFAALILFQKAAEMERVTLSLIQDAMAKLTKMRHN